MAFRRCFVQLDSGFWHVYWNTEDQFGNGLLCFSPYHAIHTNAIDPSILRYFQLNSFTLASYVLYDQDNHTFLYYVFRV